MKKKLVIGVVFLILISFLSGCTQSSICGDGVCSPGEELTCPTDCAEEVEARVNIYVSGAYDASDEITIYWHHNKDVYSDLTHSVVSRLGQDWMGEESKNLYISFNDSKSGSFPLGKDRTKTITFREQGEYYIEARTKGYEYRAVSDRVVVTDSGDYYVDLRLVPSNPALRVKAVDNEWNVLNGKGKITLTLVEESWKYGEFNTNKWVYSERVFSEKEEMNELFFVYVPRIENNLLANNHNYYEILIEKEGYQSTNLTYYPYDKYQEQYARLYKEEEVSKEVGNLEIKIVPGVGTTEEDLLKLEGLNLKIISGIFVNENGLESRAIYNSEIVNGKAVFEDVLYRNYYISDGGYYSQDPSSRETDILIYSSEGLVVNSENNYVTVTALKGINSEIEFFDNTIKSLDEEELKEIIMWGASLYDKDSTEVMELSWVDKNGVSFYEIIEDEFMNPVFLTKRIYPQDVELLPAKYIFDLEYKGVRKKFEVPMVQGHTRTEIVFSEN